MSSSTIAVDALVAALASGSAPEMIHLLSDEAFEEKRIPGSSHACVYEVAFLDKIAELLPDKSSSMVVYGLNPSFGATALAVERLSDAGYENVLVLAGGLDAWEAAGRPIEGNGEAASIVNDGTYTVDVEQSVFRWTGRNLFNQHNGRIAFKSGQIEILGGQVTGGGVILDMTRITCSDIKEASMAGMLIGHLRTDDFFSVAEFPEASFQLAKSEPIADATPGGATQLLSGNLTLRGTSRPVEISAQFAALGGKLGLQGQFEVDRTQFGSVYGSGKIFEKLGQHVVNDLISVSFQLICTN